MKAISKTLWAELELLGTLRTAGTSARLNGFWISVWLCLVAMPLAAYGDSGAQKEYREVVQSKPDRMHGEQLFAKCAACHGANGAGVPDGRVPAIAGQHGRVLAKELIDFRHDKRWDPLMEHYSDEHNLGDLQDLADVVAYIRDLRPTRTMGVGDAEFVSRGAKVYSRSCASCHGVAAVGNDLQRYPRLAGQHYAYLLRQMHDAVEGRRPNFSPEHIRLLLHFDRPDFEGVADYLSRLGN
jgi:cytochrome c553